MVDPNLIAPAAKAFARGNISRSDLTRIKANIRIGTFDSKSIVKREVRYAKQDGGVGRDTTSQNNIGDPGVPGPDVQPPADPSEPGVITTPAVSERVVLDQAVRSNLKDRGLSTSKIEKAFDTITPAGLVLKPATSSTSPTPEPSPGSPTRSGGPGDSSLDSGTLDPGKAGGADVSLGFGDLGDRLPDVSGMSGVVLAALFGIILWVLSR